jgi:hypothetical protein
MNEPHPGFIGCGDLSRTENPAKTGRALLNPQGLSLFRPGFSCPWKQAGVWTGEGEDTRLLKKEHFALYEGRPARFNDDFLKPFLIRFFDRMREAGRPALFFVQGFPQGDPPSWSAAEGEGVVHAFRCYDGPALLTETFGPRLKKMKEWTRDKMGDIPCLLGEFRLPFDLNRGRANRDTASSTASSQEDDRLREEALSLYYDGIDEHLLHAAIWNYTPMGGRLRPYPIATAGVPLLVRWDRTRAFFRYRFLADPAIEAPTEIYAPPEWLGSRPLLTVSEGLRGEYIEEERRIFVYNRGFEGEAEISAAPGD